MRVTVLAIEKSRDKSMFHVTKLKRPVLFLLWIIYIYMCVCVCVCVCNYQVPSAGEYQNYLTLQVAYSAKSLRSNLKT